MINFLKMNSLIKFIIIFLFFQTILFSIDIFTFKESLSEGQTHAKWIVGKENERSKYKIRYHWWNKFTDHSFLISPPSIKSDILIIEDVIDKTITFLEVTINKLNDSYSEMDKVFWMALMYKVGYSNFKDRSIDINDIIYASNIEVEYIKLKEFYNLPTEIPSFQSEKVNDVVKRSNSNSSSFKNNNPNNLKEDVNEVSPL